MADSLILVVVGALVTFAAGLIGAWIQSRREHSKWLRERRYEAFVAIEAVVYRLDELGQRGVALKTRLGQLNSSSTLTPPQREQREQLTRELAAYADEYDQASRQRYDSAAPLLILGPPQVEKSVSAVLRLPQDASNEDRYRADSDMIAAMRKSLGVEE
ncbi:hypothetical protein G3T36_02525 [Diaminobutyricibacter tongyongensis]|uniref:Uncharacterized protein n=1 Tax=Leifsonia tongyongensis TaxID=1268043 RepID=A0A6L9XTW9_9MICO|nr:hypothetical protein [Diaminobutyricibacter tongyongensis]NEN04735.1 hypothetical protein [Diaminobutyricibacter tongyongensis]